VEQEEIRRAGRFVESARRIVVFTGASISTESGIPDFRSPGGIWSRYDPEDFSFQNFVAHEKYRRIYWEYDILTYPDIERACPNSAHKAIVELEKIGVVSAVITQNVDGLHQKAGMSPDKVFELHGTQREVGCLKCGRRWRREVVVERMERDGIDVPYCEHCGGPLKSATITFGQALPDDVLRSAFHHAQTCDLFITIGSSLVVQPAALLPVVAKKSGAVLILINLAETPCDGLMDVIIRDRAAIAMESIIRVSDVLRR
jgi:NAD-dependent deacetylase